jgi:hypothetical protein
MRTFAPLVLTALLLPAVGSTATLTGSIIDSYDPVNLSAVGTLDWAQWPGHVTKGSTISDITTSGTFKTYTNDLRSVSGSTSGVKVGGGSASMQFTVGATTTDRTLIYYISGWNSTGRVTVSMPGATTYTTTFQSPNKYEKVVTLHFRADTNTKLTVRYEALDTAGTVNMQAAALQGSAATLSGGVVDSYAPVHLATVGTLDWARWPGHSTKAGAISDVTSTGTFKTYTNDMRAVDGDTSGVKVGGGSASLQLTAQATTSDRTLICYLSGWNSTGRITASLPGAPTYSATFSSTAKYEKVVTLRFHAASTTNLTLRYEALDTTGTVNLQACALQGGGSVPPPTTTTDGSATLTWVAPTKNTDGSPLTDLIGYKVYWGTTKGQYTKSFRINNLLATSYDVTGLASGTWYFVVTAINVAEEESGYSNVASKTIQ